MKGGDMDWTVMLGPLIVPEFQTDCRVTARLLHCRIKREQLFRCEPNLPLIEQRYRESRLTQHGRWRNAQFFQLSR
jgi:hypothetical protein